MTYSARSWEEVLTEIQSYAPTGWAMPEGQDSVLAALLEPLARGLARLEEEAEARRQTEVNPATAIYCLEDYERILGPDPCRPGGFAETLEDRQALAHARWTERGGQDLPYFRALASARGVEISIEEFSPYRCAVSCCGEWGPDLADWAYPDGAALATENGETLVTDAGAVIMTGSLKLYPPRWQLGSASMADYWRVAFGPREIGWARNSEAECGVTPHCIYEAEAEVECAINRRKPAHSIVLFDYSAHAWQRPDPQLGLF